MTYNVNYIKQCNKMSSIKLKKKTSQNIDMFAASDAMFSVTSGALPERAFHLVGFKSQSLDHFSLPCRINNSWYTQQYSTISKRDNDFISTNK